jgi:SAM-dependent methyltransferase
MQNREARHRGSKHVTIIEPTDPRMFHPHVERNREPILAVLKRLLPARALVLELASGSGEHAAFFAKALPGASWLPSDIDPKALASIAAFRTEAAVPNLLAPVRIDATAEAWPVKRLNAIVCCNMIHIAPWAACLAAQVIPQTPPRSYCSQPDRLFREPVTRNEMRAEMQPWTHAMTGHAAAIGRPRAAIS